MKNRRLRNIALSVGGAHYPEVGGELLEKFGLAVIRECKLMAGNPNQYFGDPNASEWDRGYHEAIARINSAINFRFGLDDDNTTET